MTPARLDLPPSTAPVPSGLPRILVLRGVDGAGGGADSIILRNAEQLDRHRFDMLVAFFRHVDDREFDLDVRCQALGIPHVCLPHRGAWDSRLMRRLLALADQYRPHLIHSHDYKANFFATRLSQRLQIPRVATSHGWTGHTWRERWVYYPADRWLLRSFSTVIAVSDEIRQVLRRAGVPADRIEVLLNGVDPAEFRPTPDVRKAMRAQLGLTETDWVLGGVGRLEPQKRFDRLLDAFVRIRAQIPEARLVIAGDGSLAASLRQQVDASGLTPHVQLLGHCRDVRSLYQALDGLVQSSDYEGTPTVVVEAMAAGVPIVATDVGGTSQLMTHERHGLLVKPGDVEELARAVVRLRTDPLAVAGWVTAARQRVEQELTYRQRMERLQAIYARWTEGPRGDTRRL